MNKRFLSLGMIIPLAAAGAVATAPAASAGGYHDDSKVECELKAWRHHGDIKLKLEVESEGDQGKKFKVKIWQNGDSILSTTKKDYDGDFTIRETADADDGRYFRAYVRNVKTGDDDTCRVKVSRSYRHH